MKLASIFFTASETYIRGLPQIYKQTSKKYETNFNIFFTASAKKSLFSLQIQKKVLPLHRLSKEDAQMAESVDALVSNTSGATHPGSTPGLGTELGKVEKLSPFSFSNPRNSLVC